MPAHLRMEAYSGYRRSIYPAETFRSPPRQQDVDAAIQRGRQRWDDLRRGPEPPA